jgi:hypothetical protein
LYAEEILSFDALSQRLRAGLVNVGVASLRTKKKPAHALLRVRVPQKLQ